MSECITPTRGSILVIIKQKKKKKKITTPQKKEACRPALEHMVMCFENIILGLKECCVVLEKKFKQNLNIYNINEEIAQTQEDFFCPCLNKQAVLRR